MDGCGWRRVCSYRIWTSGCARPASAGVDLTQTQTQTLTLTLTLSPTPTLNPNLFGRGLRRDMPWRLPRGLMPKHQPSAIRLLRPLNVTLATGSLAAGSAAAGAAAAGAIAAGAMAAAGVAGGVVAAPGATLARGAVVRFSSMTGLSFQRYAVSSEQ